MPTQYVDKLMNQLILNFYLGMWMYWCIKHFKFEWVIIYIKGPVNYFF